MPAICKNDSFNDNMSLYGPRWEYTIMAMALDHFFREVVEGNVPLTGDHGDERWWTQYVVVERVNRFNQNWCLLYEGLAHMRESMGEQGIGFDQIKIDANLKFTFDYRGRGQAVPIEWSADGDD